MIDWSCACAWNCRSLFAHPPASPHRAVLRVHSFECGWIALDRRAGVTSLTGQRGARWVSGGSEQGRGGGPIVRCTILSVVNRSCTLVVLLLLCSVSGRRFAARDRSGARLAAAAVAATRQRRGLTVARLSAYGCLHLVREVLMAAVHQRCRPQWQRRSSHSRSSARRPVRSRCILLARPMQHCVETATARLRRPARLAAQLHGAQLMAERLTSNRSA